MQELQVFVCGLLKGAHDWVGAARVPLISLGKLAASKGGKTLPHIEPFFYLHLLQNGSDHC